MLETVNAADGSTDSDSRDEPEEKALLWVVNILGDSAAQTIEKSKNPFSSNKLNGF